MRQSRELQLWWKSHADQPGSAHLNAQVGKRNRSKWLTDFVDYKAVGKNRIHQESVLHCWKCAFSIPNACLEQP